MEEVQLPTGQWILVEKQEGVYQTREEARLASERILAERRQTELNVADLERDYKEALRRLSPEQLLDFWRFVCGASIG